MEPETRDSWETLARDVIAWASGLVVHGSPDAVDRETLKLVEARRARLASPVAQEAAQRVEEAVREVCPLVNNEGYEDDDEGGPPMYRCLSEDGDAFIETDDPAEVIRAMSRCWLAQQERAEKAEAVAQEAAGEREVDRLRRFAAWVMAQHTGSIDGCEIEEEAVALGLMECVRCDGSCEDCCGSIPGEDNCYRPLLSAAPIPGEEGGKP